MNLLLSLRAELLKTKRTAAFYFTLAGAALAPLLTLVSLIVEDPSSKIRQDAANGIFRSEMNVLIVFPLYVILICTLVPQIEYRNNTWKQVLSSPQPKAQVFLAKFLSIHLLLLLFVAANHLFLFLALLGGHLIHPGLHLLQHAVSWRQVWTGAANSYVLLLAVGSLQFWFGLRFRNFIVPLGIGFALWFAGAVLAMDYHSPAARYYPYSFPVFCYSPDYRSQLDTVGWTSAAYAAVFLLLGYQDFRRRRLSA